MAVALMWMVTGLPLVLPAMTELPAPDSVTLNTTHFSYVLRWEPGPGTPAGVYYHVSIQTERGTSPVLVAGCEHIQQPLMCNLTAAVQDPMETYITRVTAQLEAQTSKSAVRRFTPITHLSLPLLTVTPCGRDLCVDLQPPVEHLRKSYDVLQYQLQITSNSGDRAQFLKDIRSLRRQIVEDLAPGRRYCVSVRFSDDLEGKESNFSQPVCAVTHDIFSADPWIAASLCLSVMAGVVFVGLLVCTGFICLKRRPLPSVLASIHHIEEVLVVAPSNTSLNIKPTVLSAGEKRSRQSLSDDSDGETTTESSGGSTGGGYKLRIGANLLSSSSSSSSSSAPLSPNPEQVPSLSSEQQSDSLKPQLKAQISADTHSKARLNHTASTDSLTGGGVEVHEEELEVVDQGDSQDVNLLTLTFGRLEQKGEEEEEEENMPAVECFSASEGNTAPVLLSQTWGTKEVATETVSLCADEEEEEEEEETDEYSGYMGRPQTDVLQKFL